MGPIGAVSWIFLAGLCGPSSCNWKLFALGPFVGGVDPQAGWLSLNLTIDMKAAVQE